MPPPMTLAEALGASSSVNALAQRNRNANIPPIPSTLSALIAASDDGLTIKQLILRALADHFHDGATPAELRAYILDAYGREISRGSMGPQIVRLFEEGLIEQPSDGKWKRVRPQTRLKDIG